MPATRPGNLLHELTCVLMDEGFNVTADQVIRAHAVLLRLGADRSPSGHVSLLSPIFCASADQQQRFPSLFIQAIDRSNPAQAGLTIGDGRLLLRSGSSEEPSPEPAKPRLPAILHSFAPTGLAVLFGVVLVLQLAKPAEAPPPPGSLPGVPSNALQSKRDGVPKVLPKIDGRSRLDIQIDSSGRDEVPASWMQKQPGLADAYLGALIALWAFLAWLLRKHWDSLTRPKRDIALTPVPQPLRYKWSSGNFTLPVQAGLGAQIDISKSIREHARLGYWKELAKRPSPHVPGAPEPGKAEEAVPVLTPSRHQNGIVTHVDLPLPILIKGRFLQGAAIAGLALLALTAVVPFLGLLSVKNKAHHIASKPDGVDFGDWICFTKIEQSIVWHIAPDTVIQKIEIEGYDQTDAGEGFQLVSRSDPRMTIGPVLEVDGSYADRASLVFLPLHAHDYTGTLKIQTNHGLIRFGLRGTGVYGGDACVDEGHGQYGLESDFNGNGCNQIDMRNGQVRALLAPERPTGPSDSHSALVLGPWRQGEFELQCGIRTIAQLRDSGPNPWEVGWLIWNFADLNHFYYLSLKANGWELGRKDPSFPGGVKFLATKNSPQFPPGQRYFVRLNRQGDLLTVDVNGSRLVTITDVDHPVASGRIGFYSECADSLFDSLEIR